ncbi:DUF4817 domain-containing protein [Trichonephila clavata]|uniref:DUF4817 domain-containing protein n=1 Tax=Trichonephila clavata TaxID=2740835 RepID=A0A8X6FRA1_TRICU|nr:DUF4817 domain-containing protein [Trichonephila clavata]
MMNRIGVDSNFLEHGIFSDESCFHKLGKANKRNCRVWENENPHQLCEYERDTPKVNMWLGMHTNGIIGSFFFVEKTVTGHVYLDMLENFAVPQIPPGFLFQQDDTPPHYHGDVTAFLNKTFQGSKIGREAQLPGHQGLQI